MSNFSTGYHKWLAGENRTDGWKSPWRITLERSAAEDALKPRLFVRAKQIIERQKRPRIGPHNATPRKCEVCDTGIRQINRTGRCIKHPLAKGLPVKATRKCGACDESIRKTKFGLCPPCFVSHRRLIQQSQVRVCAEPKCFCSLNKNNTHTKCRKHSRAERYEKEMLRQRTKRMELKKAA